MHHLTVLTPAGRGAVATVRLSGLSLLEASPALWSAANSSLLTEQPLGRVCFGHWGSESTEEVVLCRVEPDVVEIHCHGGEAAVSRIVADLEARGCESLTWQTTEQSALGQVEAECREALTRATTLRTADLLCQQCQGRLAGVFAQLEVLPPEQAKSRAEELLRWAKFGIHLTLPWQVVLCGRPNVGKSSLINALVGYGRSIVFNQPGTTRDVVTAETAFDGWPIEFSDTAGIRESADDLESAGIQRARLRLAQADLRVLLIDTSQAATRDDQQLLTDWPDALVVAHKSDLPLAWGTDLPPHSLPVSSRTRAGLDTLIAAIVTRLVGEVPLPQTPIPVTSRQVAFLRSFQ